jgi:N-acetylglutamate synthase-like GNAT family acetyltransferase
MYTLRHARASDDPTIRALIHAVGINPMALDWQRFLVAINVDDHVIGTGQVKPHRDGTRELASIAVDPCCRDQGIAHAIIDRLLVENPRPLYLTCRSSLQGFYMQFGFQVIQNPARLPPYFRHMDTLGKTMQRLHFFKEPLLVMKR